MTALHTMLDSGSDDGCPSCWLCLCGPEAGKLLLPCKCPTMYSHPVCLARWQLQQAGMDEECFCRFCKSTLPKWSGPLMEQCPRGTSYPPEDAAACPRDLAAAVSDSKPDTQPVVPIMAVVFQGRVVKLPCMPGKEGVEQFKSQVRSIFGLDESVSLDVTFELKVPALPDEAGQKVYLKGFHTFEAASTVAAMCATKRQQCGRPAAVPTPLPLTRSSVAAEELIYVPAMVRNGSAVNGRPRDNSLDANGRELDGLSNLAPSSRSIADGPVPPTSTGARLAGGPSGPSLQAPGGSGSLLHVPNLEIESLTDARAAMEHQVGSDTLSHLTGGSGLKGQGTELLVKIRNWLRL